MALKPLLTDETGKAIADAIKSTDVAKARIAEINAAADEKKQEVLDSIPEDYTELTNEVSQLSSEKVDKDGEGQVNPLNCTFFDFEKSNNVWNPSTQEVGYGIDASGNIVESVGYVLSELIPVTGQYIYFARKTPTSDVYLSKSMYRLATFDADKNFIQRLSSVMSGIDVSGVAYVRVMSAYDDGWKGFLAFSDDTTVPTYDDYFVREIIKSDNLPKDNANAFEGLLAVAFGTSLTARAEEDNKYDYTTHGYLTYLRQYSGMEIDNQGIGGAVILSDSTEKSIYTAITGYADYASKQVCIIEGFFNDWYKNTANTLGQYTDTSNDTVCGRVRNAIGHIMAQNPNITIFAVFDHYGQNNSNIDASSTVVLNGYTQYQYYSEIIKVCESLGVVCVKECALSGIGELAPQYLEDYIHLNDLGAKQSAMTIWNEMKRYSPKLF